MDNKNNSTTQDSQLTQSTTESNQESQTTAYVDNHEAPKHSKKALLAISIIILLPIVCYTCFKILKTDTDLDSFFIAEKYDRIINSSSSREEAKRAVEEEFNDESYGISNTVTKNEIIEETEDYYGLDVSWDYKSNNLSQTYSEKVISFKKNIYDYEFVFSHSTGGEILTNKMITKNKDKIKAVLDAIYKIRNKQNGSFEWLNSQLNEDSKKYTYELKYQETVFGDWGLEDKVSTETITLYINKNTGEISETRTTK